MELITHADFAFIYLIIGPQPLLDQRERGREIEMRGKKNRIRTVSGNESEPVWPVLLGEVGQRKRHMMIACYRERKKILEKIFDTLFRMHYTILSKVEV